MKVNQLEVFGLVVIERFQQLIRDDPNIFECRRRGGLRLRGTGCQRTGSFYRFLLVNIMTCPNHPERIAVRTGTQQRPVSESHQFRGICRNFAVC